MKIVHISDMHFGAELDHMVPILESCIAELEPDLVVASGDFTQNGTAREFQVARDFLNGLSAPVFCIPGNHDVPRLNLMLRLLQPYKLYKKYIAKDLSPVFENDVARIAGFNSARRALPHWNWANGAVSASQRHAIQKLFKEAGGKYRICVFHHPLHRAAESPLKVKVFGTKRTLHTLNDLHIDIVLTGHVHHASVDAVDDMVFVSASTAISRRTRMQNNGFNVIELNDEFFEIRHFVFDKDKFVENGTVRHKKNR
ncbi:MAG: metallophosphoesterase family protein [Alphaproteobacteria bacterium]